MLQSHVKPPQFKDSIFFSFFEENTWDTHRNVAVACASIENLQVARIFHSRINVDETAGVFSSKASSGHEWEATVGYHLLHFLSRQSIPVGVLLLELSNAPTGRSFD